MRFTSTLAVFLTPIILLSACTSTSLGTKVPIEDRNSTPSKDSTSTNPAASTRSVPTTSEVKPAAIESRAVETIVVPPSQQKNDAVDMPSKRSIYFDYNSYTINNEYKALVESHAKYLVAKRGQKIIIQGNTDERGGREFNLALGQKRAEAVRKALLLLNVPETQMEAVSFGKEKPKSRASTEAAWAENRRADIVYP